MSCTYIAIVSKKYLLYYCELYKSIKQYSPSSKQILYYVDTDWDKISDEDAFNLKDPTLPKEFDEVVNITCDYIDCNKDYNTLERICSLRARVVLDAFEKGNDKVIFCGAKLKFFWYPDQLEYSLEKNNAVVTPHITGPLPEDGKFPSNEQVSFTGHVSTDLVAFKNVPEIIEFLKWQDEIMKTKCQTSSKTYLDQSWLNFLPFFVRNVKILHNQAYNVAYWNYKQRYLRKSDPGVWLVDDDGCGKSMVCFQYSGLDPNHPEKISTHQNREIAEGDFLQFLTEYANLVK